MILKGKKSFNFPSWLPWVLLAACLVGWWYVSTDSDTVGQTSLALFSCDAEKVVSSGGEQHFKTNGQLWSNGQTRSAEEAHTGSYASKLDKNFQYGMSLVISAPLAGHKYTVSVWRKSETPLNGYIVIKQNPNTEEYVQSNRVVEEGDNGWQRLEVTMLVPEQTQVDSLIVFPYINSKESVVYFDDITVSVYHPLNELDSLEERLHIYLDDKALRKIEAKRLDALADGILQSSDDDWVKARMTANDETEYNVKLRLKGDWTDHLKGDYWSYRIKMPSDQSWNRLMTFSLQDPSTRYFVHEWLYHKVLEKEDVITPRYGFVKLSQNNQAATMYAYEEHFEKQIVEYKNRREGVILKFGETAMWEERHRNRKLGLKNYYYGAFEVAEVEVFKEGKVTADPKLQKQFDHGRELLTAYQLGTLPLAQIFDIERLAKLYAIAEVMDAHHGLIWHNQRFYYNPVTRLLEPIGFDGYTEAGPYKIYKNLFFGEYMTSDDVPYYRANYKRIFEDKAFARRYIPLMLQYSEKGYLEQILEEKTKEIQTYEYLLGIEHNGYQFDKQSVLKRAEMLAANLRPYDELSIQAYTGLSKDESQVVSVANRHPLPLEIVASAATAQGAAVSLSEPIWINSSPMLGPAKFEELQLPAGTKLIYYRLPGTEQLYSTTVKKWTAPGLPEVRYAKDTQIQLPIPSEGKQISADGVLIKEGSYTIDKPVIIPAGTALYIEPGTTIDLVDNAYILSYSPVYLKGTADRPILITSSDRTSQGFLVQEADGRSQLHHTLFTHLNTLSENEWQLTGAVTFYESNVYMVNVTISDNYCEDALNLVRSEFRIEGLNINTTFADGFDGDFCKGLIKDSYLHHTGNDGLDFSGSNIHVENVRLEHIGDKGISAGEEATVYVVSASISDAEIGVASKDLSKVTVQQLSLKSVGQGFASYQKKPEFGGGYIYVGEYTAEDVRQLTIVDEQSKIDFRATSK